MKNYQQTPKQHRIQNRKLELSKRAVAQSKRYQPEHFCRLEQEDIRNRQSHSAKDVYGHNWRYRSWY